jgi:uncharacterized protein involved in exopolysaccharide biosynthesis
MLQSSIGPGDSQRPLVVAGDDADRRGGQSSAPLIVQYWHTAVRWKWIILGVIATSLVIGLIATLLMTPKYTATSRIEISREQKNIVDVEGVESKETGRDLEFYQTQYSLLESRSLAQRVVRDLNLAATDDFFLAHGESPEDASVFSVRRRGTISAAERAKREKRAVKLLLDHISISPIRGSSLVDISYTSSSPELSMRVANSWTEQFIQTSMDRRFASTADARKFLEGRLADLRSRVEKSERDLVGYATRKEIVTLSKSEDAEGRTQTQRTLVSDNLEALNAALARATADRIAAESRTQTGAARGANSEALSNLAISELRQKRAQVAAD